MRLYLDYETWSAANIRRGTDVYLNHAKPLLATWAFDDSRVYYHDFVRSGSEPPAEFQEALTDPSVEKYAHNAFFDRFVTERLLHIPADIYQWRCSMALALSHALPGGLEALGTVLNVPMDQAKIADGRRLILKFCCGKTPPDGRDPEWPLFINYAIHDITAMRECVKRIPNWNYKGEELRVWHVDQIINNRGFKVDVKLAEEAVTALKAQKEQLDNAVWIATCGSVSAATQRDKLLLYLCESQGCVLKDLRAPTILAALEDESLEESTRALLRIRLEASKTSTSKFKRMLESVGKDGRLRGTLQFAGASRTARWAGRIFQPQNLPRPTMSADFTRQFIDLLREGKSAYAALIAPITKGCSNSLRGLIVSEDDTALYVADYSAIEGRGNAWVAGEDWKLKAFREKQDLYKLIYAKAFGMRVELVEKWQRQIGKVMELALGYQGGVGAFLNMAAAYNLDLDAMSEQVELDEKSAANWERAIKENRTYNLTEQVYRACDTLKNGYRKANPAIVQSWYMYEAAAREVISINDPAHRAHVGPLTFDCNGHWLRIKLPSGRYLCYAQPKIHKARTECGGAISYMAWRNKKWSRTKTYGGKFCENIVQAVSRDLLAHAILVMHDHNVPVVLHVHDEAIAEKHPSYPLVDFLKLMSSKPKWAAGFPLDAEGFSSRRYEKS